MFENEIKEMVKSELRGLRQQVEKINENKEPLKETISYIESLKSTILEVGFKESQVSDICLLIIDGVTFDTSECPYTIPKQLIMVEAVNEGFVTEYCKMLKFYYDEFSKMNFNDKEIFKLIKVFCKQ